MPARNPVTVILPLTPFSLVCTILSLLLSILIAKYDVRIGEPHWFSTTPRRGASIIGEDEMNLHNLLANVADALDEANVTYWLVPGLGLLPPSKSENNEIGKFSVWHEGADIAVYQTDLLAIIAAQSEMQRYGIVAVESYFGLRLFSLSGNADDRYDFRTPFIDMMYFKEEAGNMVSYCCDCAPISIGPCTKKTCGCMFCVADAQDVFPLTYVNIENVRRKLPAPHNSNTLLLHPDTENIHPLVFD